MADLKVAVIGCGGHAQSHFRMIAEESRLRLVGIAELDEERRQKNQTEWGPERAFADYREMLDVCQPDVVHVVTMPGHLLPIVLDCLERGLHTSVEKAPGMTAAETAQMAEAAQQSEGKALVSFNRRYFPQVLAVRQRIEAAGGAVHCAATYNKPVTLLGPATPDPVATPFTTSICCAGWLAAAPRQRPFRWRYRGWCKTASGLDATATTLWCVSIRVPSAP